MTSNTKSVLWAALAIALVPINFFIFSFFVFYLNYFDNTISLVGIGVTGICWTLLTYMVFFKMFKDRGYSVILALGYFLLTLCLVCFDRSNVTRTMTVGFPMMLIFQYVLLCFVGVNRTMGNKKLRGALYVLWFILAIYIGYSLSTDGQKENVLKAQCFQANTSEELISCQIEVAYSELLSKQEMYDIYYKKKDILSDKDFYSGFKVSYLQCLHSSPCNVYDEKTLNSVQNKCFINSTTGNNACVRDYLEVATPDSVNIPKFSNLIMSDIIEHGPENNTFDIDYCAGNLRHFYNKMTQPQKDSIDKAVKLECENKPA